MKCLVKKLGVSIENDSLPVFVENLKNQIDVVSDDSNIKIVGEGLPVTSFFLKYVVIEVAFNVVNNATIGDVIKGYISESRTRLYLGKPYKASSQGESTCEINCFSGSGEQTITDTISLKKGEDILCRFKDKDISFNDMVYTQPIYNDNQEIVSLLLFGVKSRKDMFAMKYVKITDITTNNTILEAYPALKDGKACLYDVVNNVYYEGTGDFEVE